jgi:hypothetical protein
MPEKNEEKGAKIIQGPWKKRKINQHDEKVIAEHMSRNNADEFTVSVVQEMVRMMHEHGVDIDETSFIRDVSMIFELVQSTIYRDIEFSHPMQKFVEKFVTVSTHPNNEIVTEVAFGSIYSLVELLEYHDDPEIS